MFRTLQVGDTVVPFENLVKLGGEGIMDIDAYLGIGEEWDERKCWKGFLWDSSFSKMTSEEAKHTSDGGKYNTTLWMPEVVHYFKENLQKAKRT